MLEDTYMLYIGRHTYEYVGDTQTHGQICGTYKVCFLVDLTLIEADFIPAQLSKKIRF